MNEEFIDQLSDKECLVTILMILNTPVWRRKLGEENNLILKRGINYLKEFLPDSYLMNFSDYL